MRPFTAGSDGRQTGLRPASAPPSALLRKHWGAYTGGGRAASEMPFHICTWLSGFTGLLCNRLWQLHCSTSPPPPVDSPQYARPPGAGRGQAPFLSETVIYFGNLSKGATGNAFYFYGDLVPKDRDSIRRKAFCQACGCVPGTRAETLGAPNPQLHAGTAPRGPGWALRTGGPEAPVSAGTGPMARRARTAQGLPAPPTLTACITAPLTAPLRTHLRFSGEGPRTCLRRPARCESRRWFLTPSSRSFCFSRIGVLVCSPRGFPEFLSLSSSCPALALPPVFLGTVTS